MVESGTPDYTRLTFIGLLGDAARIPLSGAVAAGDKGAYEARVATCASPRRSPTDATVLAPPSWAILARPGEPTISAWQSHAAARRTGVLLAVKIESPMLPPSAPRGRRGTCHICPATHRTMSRTGSPAGFMSACSTVCLTSQPRVKSPPDRACGDHDARRRDGRQGLRGSRDEQRGQTIRHHRSRRSRRSGLGRLN
jgi:hypothetical protein